MDWLNKSNQVNNSSKQDICDNYLSLTDPSFVKNVKNNYEDFCLKCNIEKKTSSRWMYGMSKLWTS